MKISGFTILRNAVALDYPFVESVRSLLPVVDELIAVVAAGDDETWDALQGLGESRIVPVRTDWAASGTHGAELSRQTNIALGRCTGTWAIYLQADEVLHEDDHAVLGDAMRWHGHRDTEGLVFDYLHFFRAYSLVADDWLAFYPRAVRAVRTGMGIESAGDAAGFVRRRGPQSRGLLKASSGARVFHYGWADTGKLERARSLSAYYHPPEEAGRIRQEDLFPAGANRMCLREFTGAHPAPMRARVAASVVAPPPYRRGRLPAWCRAWARVASAPSAHVEAMRPFVPLALTNLRWRWRDQVS